MANAENVITKEIMETEPVKAQNDESLSQIKNRMEENGLKAIPVVNSENQLQGAIGYRDLIRYIQFNPENTNLSKVMHQPPKFDLDDNLIDIADLRINSGKKMMVSLNNKKLAGIIGEEQLLEALSDIDELENVKTKDIESRDLLTVFEQDSLEEARHKMLDNNISRLPILDKDGKLSGIIRSTDMLKMMVPREAQSAGGTSGRRKSTKEVNIAGGSEKDRMSEIPVKELMKSDVNTSEKHLTGIEAVEKMKREGNDEIVITDGEYPESIVTLKDLINFLESFAPGNTVLVNLIGLEVPEEKAAVHRKVKKQLQGSLGRKLHKPEELSIYFRKAEKDGKKHRYEIDLKLYSEYGQITINEEGWELLDVVDEALNQLNSVVRREKEKMTEHN